MDDEFRRNNMCTYKKIATNDVYCLKYPLSSADFVQLYDKAHLISTKSTATQNDGAEQRFTSEMLFIKIHQKCF